MPACGCACAHSVLTSTLTYVQRFNQFRGEHVAASLREAMAAKDIVGMDAVMMANLVPESVGDAKTLVESLADKPDEDVEEVIEQLNKYRRYA